MEKIFSKLKENTQLSTVSTPIDLKKTIEYYNKLTSEIMKNDSETIIKVLMHDKYLLPKYKDVLQTIEKNKKKSVLTSLFSKQIFDSHGNPAQNFIKDDERINYDILKFYSLQLKPFKQLLVNNIIETAIKKEKLNENIVLKYLYEHSWFGKNILKKVFNDTITYDWLQSLSPAIQEYFIQMRYYFMSNNYPNLILCMDSLVLKIEGLIRDICSFKGISTTKSKRDKNNKSIVREKDINELLYAKGIKELFDEDDLLFFKFLLVEQSGYNLRHKIAHSLMIYQEYNIDFMNLLFVALLKFGKYDFVKPEKENNTNPKNKKKK